MGSISIYETALLDFLKPSPKYAATAKASLMGAAVMSSVMLGSLVAQKLIDVGQLKKARISTKDTIMFLQGEIQKCQEAIISKESTIKQLQKQIETDEAQIVEFQKLINSLSVEEEDIHD